MRLYLVQHGEAHPEEIDRERRLTPKGEEEVRKVARFLAPRGLTVKAIWHSGKTRARQTAEILAEAVTAARGVEARRGLDPKDSVRPVAEEIHAAGEDILIAGHLPFLARLASVLVAGGEETPVVTFRYGCVVALERGEDGRWSVVWMVVPEILP
ncbi:MAG: phosphohistidine phosphatase SixA [Planctomycetes bacterium]|nr:phosphohistidine phosphatase SixA [Planctomycetota bacterium]